MDGYALRRPEGELIKDPPFAHTATLKKGPEPIVEEGLREYFSANSHSTVLLWLPQQETLSTPSGMSSQVQESKIGD